MLSLVHRLALFLNQYANLLLVLVTGAYVWLTWRNLGALREASLREREARHLDEIKETVIKPIVSWISQTVFERFTGKTPTLLVLSGGYGGIPRQLTHQVDDPFIGRRRLKTPANTDVPDPLGTWESTEFGRVPKFLYEHSKQDHFPRQLREFDRLLEEVTGLTAALILFANGCAGDIGSREIPLASSIDDENSMPEWINPHLLAAECIHALLHGDECLRIYVQDNQVRDAHSFLLKTGQGQLVAKAPQSDKLERWRDDIFVRVRKRWEERGLAERVTRLLNEAGNVRRNIEELRFTQGLGVDCVLVSGEKRRRWPFTGQGAR